MIRCFIFSSLILNVFFFSPNRTIFLLVYTNLCLLEQIQCNCFFFFLATTTTTTSRPSPPWLIASQPSVWSTAKLPTIRPQSHPHSRGSNSSPENSSEKVTSTTAGTVSKSAVPREPPPTTRPPAPPPPYEDSSVDPVPYFTVTPSPPSAPAWKTSIKPAPLPGA